MKNKIKINVLITFFLLALFNTNNSHADRLSDMISPAFHPVTFEDPRAISEARLLYAYHKIDDKFVTAGGDVQIYALQLRYALNERLALIATKDGYVDFNPKATLPKKTGFADIAVGAKYAFYLDAEAGQIITGALRYTIPTGNRKVLQGEGDGEIHPSISAAFALCDKTTVTFGTGLRLALDSDFSSFWDTDIQVDYRIETPIGAIHPLIGASAIHIIDSGNRLPIADEGQDFFNLGASESNGETILLGAVGARVRPLENLDFGSSFQFPLDAGTGSRIIDYRVLVDAIVRF